MALSSFGIVYNRDVLRYLGVARPENLARPRRRETRRLVSSPAMQRAVSSARQAYMIIVERAMIDAAQAGRSEDDGWADGMGLVRLICSNARYYTDAASAVPNVIASGDAAVGMAIDFYAQRKLTR